MDPCETCFEQDRDIAKYVAIAGITPEDFRARFAYLVEEEQKRQPGHLSPH